MRRATLLRAAAVLLAVLAAAGTAHAQKSPKFPATAIQIQFVRAAEVTLPPEFQVALYEYMVEEVKKTGKFQRVYRDGDSNPVCARRRCHPAAGIPGGAL